MGSSKRSRLGQSSQLRRLILISSAFVLLLAVTYVPLLGASSSRTYQPMWMSFPAHPTSTVSTHNSTSYDYLSNIYTFPFLSEEAMKHSAVSLLLEKDSLDATKTFGSLERELTLSNGLENSAWQTGAGDGYFQFMNGTLILSPSSPPGYLAVYTNLILPDRTRFIDVGVSMANNATWRLIIDSSIGLYDTNEVYDHNGTGLFTFEIPEDVGVASLTFWAQLSKLSEVGEVKISSLSAYRLLDNPRISVRVNMHLILDEELGYENGRWYLPTKYDKNYFFVWQGPFFRIPLNTSTLATETHIEIVVQGPVELNVGSLIIYIEPNAGDVESPAWIGFPVAIAAIVIGDAIFLLMLLRRLFSVD